jgi:hypothetical protein
MNKAKAVQQNVKGEAEQLLSELQRLRDEIRLKLHLANAEGRDAWKALEPQLQQFSQHVETATGAAVQRLHSAGDELRVRLERLCGELKKSRGATPSA